MRNRHLYPKDWERISLEIRTKANWQCQCCGKKCRVTGESIEQFIARTGYSEVEVKAKPIRWCLTTAHLNHIPADCRPENLAALCAPCHLRNDAAQHVKTRRINRRMTLEKHGQLVLF